MGELMRISGLMGKLTSLSEMLGFSVELNDFSGAHEGEVERVEEKHNIFALVIIKRDLLESTVNIGHAFEPRCRLLDSS